MKTHPFLLLNLRALSRSVAAFLAVLILTLPTAVKAANGTWLNTGATDENWSTTTNWTGGTVPGATSGTTNADTATFNTAVGTYGTSGAPILIDSGRNLKSITFDLATAGAYFIGTTGGNSLLLSSTGAITMNPAVANTETINAPLVIQGAAGTYAFTNNATDNSKLLNIGGGITGGAAGATVLTLSGTNTGANTVSGVIGNGSATTVAVTKSGAGTWVLSNANTYTGLTTVSGGTLSLAHAGGTIADTAAVTISSGATLDVAQSDTVGAVTISNGGTISGAGTLTGASYAVTTGGNPTISANLAGSGVLSSTFTPAIITISGNNSGWSGTIGASGASMASTLLVSNTNALGTGTVYLSGILQASADLSAGIGNNLVTTGATVSGSNNITINGSLTNTTGTSFKSSITGGTLVLAGSVYLSDLVGTARTLTLAGTGNTTISGVIANANGGGLAGGFAMSGSGVTTSTNNNTYTGATTVSAGTLSLAGASGAMTGTASLAIGNGATFTIDERGFAAVANRLNNSAAITINSAGTFKYIGSDLANSTESIGAITLNNAVATITVNSSGSNTATVTAAAATGGITRSFTATTAPGIALINGVNLGSGTSGVGQFLTATAPTLVGTTVGGTTGINSSAKNTKIVAYLLGESGTASGANGTASGVANTFLTYNATTGYRPLNPTDEFTNNAISTGNNTYITSATTSSSSTAINSLVINGGNLVINDGTTLTNTSSALLFASSNSIAPSSSSGVLAFGAAEGIVSVGQGLVGTITSAITTGATGLSIYGPGTLVLNGSSGSLAGTTNVMNGANLVIGNDTALGSSLLRMNGGTISVLTQARTISNTLSLNTSGSVTVAGTGNLTLTGSGSNPGFSIVHQVNPVFNITNTGTITISGAYALDNGATPNNNPVGPTLASSANLVITGAILDTNSANVGSGLGSQAAFKFAGAGANLTIIGNNAFGGTQASSTIITPTVGAGYNTITIGGSSSTITPFGLGALNTNSGVGFFLVANASGKTLGNNISLGASTNNDGGRPVGFAGTNDLTLGGTFTLGASISVPNISSATLTFGNTVTVGGSTLTILGPGNTTFNSAGAISGTTGSFAKTGTGTLTLSGTNNLTGTTTLSGGTTVLDYSATNANRLTQGTTATALTLAGNNLQLQGGTYTQALGTGGGTTLNAGQSSITRTGGGTSTIALGALTRAANSGGVINFGTGAATTTTANNSAGILGGYAIVNGADWAVANGGGTAISALGSYTSLPATGAVSTGNYYYTGSTPLTTSGSSPTLGSLKMDASANLTIGTTNMSVGGFLFTGSSPVSITGGALVSGGELIIQNYGTGVLTLASALGTGSNATSFSGTGTTVLSNASSPFTGATFLNGGTVQISAIGNLGASTTAAITFNGGTLDVTAAGITNVRPVTIAANGGTIQVDTGTLTFGSAAIISGSSLGGLTKTGAGTLLLQAPSTFVGPVTVSNGTLKLGNAAALGASATGSNRSTAPVLVNGGVLDLASFTAGLGNVTLSSGSIIDSVGGGSLGAYSFTLQGGTVSAALADVVVPVTTNVSNSINVYKTTSGMVTLSGANTYTGSTTISGGTLQSANNAALSSTAVVNVNNSGSTLAVNYGGGSDYTQTQVGTLLAKTNFGATTTALGFDTTNGNGTYSNALTMAAGLTKLGSNTLTLSGANTYTGSTLVSSGTLVVNGSVTSSAVSVSSGATLGGSGTLAGSTLSGAGQVGPGNSPGILAASQVDPSGGLDFNFEYTSTGAPTWNNAASSVNDVLRLTNAATPFTANLTNANVVSFYLNVASLAEATSYQGGFFTDRSSDFLSSVQNANKAFYVFGNGSGTHAYNSVNYYTLAEYNTLISGSFDVTLGTFQVASANFSDGTISNGWVTELTVVPEPSTWALLAFSLMTVIIFRRRRA